MLDLSFKQLNTYRTYRVAIASQVHLPSISVHTTNNIQKIGTYWCVCVCNATALSCILYPSFIYKVSPSRRRVSHFFPK